MLTLVFYLNSHFRKIADVNQNMIQKNHFDMMYSTFHFFPIMLSLSPMHKFFKSHLWCLAFHDHEVYCDACDVLQVTCIILDQFFKARGGAYIMNIRSVFKDPPPPLTKSMLLLRKMWAWDYHLILTCISLTPHIIVRLKELYTS